MKRIIIIAVAGMLATGCGYDGNSVSRPNIREELTISGLSDSRWTYFSIETGEIVGSGDFLSEKENREWAARKDWDFAICGDYIKTNSGTSGEGYGGVLRDNTSNFLTLKEAPADGYLTDRPGPVTAPGSPALP